jgi:hypothetical protein
MAVAAIFVFMSEYTLHGLSAGQVHRYSRQLLLEQFGVAGQEALCRGSALVVGAGGLGSPVILYDRRPLAVGLGFGCAGVQACWRAGTQARRHAPSGRDSSCAQG